MTQEEKLIARLKSLEPGLYRFFVVILPDGSLGFWVLENNQWKLEGIKV